MNQDDRRAYRAVLITGGGLTLVGILAALNTLDDGADRNNVVMMVGGAAGLLCVIVATVIVLRGRQK